MRLFGFSRKQTVCPHCGWEIAADANSCAYCENPIDVDRRNVEGGCRYCKVLGAVFVLVLLGGLVALLLQAANL